MKYISKMVNRLESLMQRFDFQDDLYEDCLQ